MTPILDLKGVAKRYTSGHTALHGVDLAIAPGEIFALLGPNGAGKTTLISIVCGTVSPSEGSIAIDGHDALTDVRAARAKVGLVPQEIALDIFATVADTVRFTRGLYGRAPDPAHVERLLRDLSLWEKRDQKVIALSGGMKRRVMIAKALSHEPRLLFLDEPTAGVDVTLRRDMWALVRRLRDQGVTIVLTTHYIEEAEEMADRVGVIDKGRLLLVEDKAALMRKLGKRRLTLTLAEPMTAIPAALDGCDLTLEEGGTRLVHSFAAEGENASVPALLATLGTLGIAFTDLDTQKSSLEDIFVDLVGQAA